MAVNSTRRRMPAEERRKLILEEARAAFLEAGEGMRGVSARTIADRCGIDEALVYRHFGTKENLYFEAITAPVDDVIARFAERIAAIPPRDTPAEQVQREVELTRQCFEWLLAMPPDIVRAVGMLLVGDRGRAAAFYDRTLGPALGTLESLTEHELGNWDHVDFSIPLGVRSVVATVFWLLMEEEVTGLPVDREAAARQLTDLLIYGMAARD